MIFRVESYSKKQNSFKCRWYFSASINKGWKPHVRLWRLRWRDTKIRSIFWLGKFQRVNLARTGCWKWNRSCDWLISWKECGSVVSSCFFGGSVAWHPKKKLWRRLHCLGPSLQISFRKKFLYSKKELFAWSTFCLLECMRFHIWLNLTSCQLQCSTSNFHRS